MASYKEYEKSKRRKVERGNDMAIIESEAGLGIPLIFLVSFGFIATCVLVIFLYHRFARFQLISCEEEKVEAPVMLSQLNKRTKQRRCSSWGKEKLMMYCWRSYLKP